LQSCSFAVRKDIQLVKKSWLQKFSTVLSESPNLTYNLSLRFNGHFPGEPGLASFIEAKDDGSSGDNWSNKSCKAPQSNRHHQQTNIQVFTGWMHCSGKRVQQLKKNVESHVFFGF